MTKEECAIVTIYTGVAMLEGDDLEYLYRYAEKLMERPVFTHELATLADELKKRAKPDFINLCRWASAQPNTSNTLNALDCISRQAAIDALEKVAELYPWKVPGKRDTYDSYNEAWNDAIGRAEMEIETLSPEQPLVIHCTACEDWHTRQGVLGISVSDLPSAQPETHEKRTETHACDCISRQYAIANYQHVCRRTSCKECPLHICDESRGFTDCELELFLHNLPSAQPEPLTDKEQRIFLAAMEREEKVCEEVDRNYVREPYEDSLMRVCKEIRRKVKGALWT